MRSNISSKSSSATDRRRGLLRMLADDQAGFSIIEVVVAALILTLISGAVATGLVSTARFSGDQRKRSQADEIAQQDQERLRGMSIKQLSGLNETRTVGPYEGTVYTVESTGQFLSNTGSSSCGSSGTGAAAYVFVRSKVNWDANLRADGTSIRPPVTQEGLITPKAGGTLLVNVKDQNNVGVPGALISIAGKETESATTGTEGCAIFGGITPSGYYVWAEKAGYVDPNGNDKPIGGATVTASGTSYPSPNPFLLGEAGSIQATFSATGATGGQHAPSLSVSHANRSSTLVTTPSSPGTPITTTDTLYPFLTSYTAWAGKCPGEQPPSANRTSVLVGQNQAQTAVVTEPGMNLKLFSPTQLTANRKKPDQVKLTYTQTTGGTCSESWLPAIRSDGATATNGSLVSPGQPYAGPTTVGTTTYDGTYTICAAWDADGSGPGQSQYAQLTNQTLTDFTSLTAKNVIITSTSPTGTCP